jgi:uncharacterized membrane protein
MAHRTLVALYDHLSEARSAVSELVKSGVPRDQINLVASDSTREYEGELALDRNAARHESTDMAGSGAVLGSVLGGMTGLLVGLGAFAIPGVGPIIAAGPIVAALTGAGAGAATLGILGSLADLGISESEAHNYAEGVRRGGTLVSVKLEEVEATRVSTILEKYNPVDIEQRGAAWRESGWTGFDSSAKPYDATEIAAERERYGIEAPASMSADEDSLETSSFSRTSRM